MKVILIMLDTLNRRALKTYNPCSMAITPNIDRLAERSVIFDNHFIGSAPCMPARRDILTGRLNFLERGWGPIEAYDKTFVKVLRENHIFTHIVTDHCHYAEIGGENYMQQYNTWNLIRGQETDAWASKIKSPSMPQTYKGRIGRQYQCNREHFVTDADYPTPKTFASAIEWLQQNGSEDNYFLTVEGFDPHEPFDCTDEYKKLYEKDYQGGYYEWPNYSALTNETEEDIKHLNNLYCANLSMADRWLGKLTDEFDRQNLWDDTLIIFTSDHGHMLGEHGVTGKNLFHAWNEMSHIPLFVHRPGEKDCGKMVSALTQNIDLAPTLLEYFDVVDYDVAKKDMHGKSLLPLLSGQIEKLRDFAIYGWFGSTVNITDSTYTYFRAANKKNEPLFAYMSMPTTYQHYLGAGSSADNMTAGKFLDKVEMPLYRLKIVSNENERKFTNQSLLFNIKTDYQQLQPLCDDSLEKEMIISLKRAMEEHDAPPEQYERLDLLFAND